MHLKNIDFVGERAEDCVLIDTKEWVDNPCCLKKYRLSGRDIATYLTKALRVNPVKEAFEGLITAGDTLFITRVAAEVAPLRAFALDTEERYYHLPITQVIGYFSGGIIGLDTLNLLVNKVLVKKVEPSYETFLMTTNDNTMVGEVVKVGLGKLTKDFKLQAPEVQIGDIILIRDNVDTEIYLDGSYYYAVDETMVVGKFTETPYSLSTMKVMNNSVIMKEHIPNKVLNSKLLTPGLNYEDLDYTENYNRNLFQIVASDNNLTKVGTNDTILVLRDLTNYVYFNLEKYFIISEPSFIEARVIEGGN